MEDVFGKVYIDFYEKKGPLCYFIERNDGLLSFRRSELYFQNFDHWSKEEQNLIQTIFDNKFKSVLDIGAGAGRVSLYLQDRGVDVVALDNSHGAIEVCQSRGIKKTYQGNIFSYKSTQSFDCVLLLGNNLAIGMDYEGTKKLLLKCKELIKSNGQILLQFVSPVPTENSDHLNYQELNKAQGRRIGEITNRLRYRTMKTSWFKLFLPTEKEFEELIEETGLKILQKWNYTANSFYIQLGKTG